MSDVLERFVRYVQVDSQSDPDDMDQTPSTPCQHKMAELLRRRAERRRLRRRHRGASTPT